jgi:hypothetical protein
MLEGFVAEGGGPSVDIVPTWERGTVQLRQVTEAYQITEMARLVNIHDGAGGSAKAASQKSAILKMEMMLEYWRFKGRNAVNARSFDGLVALMEALCPNNIVDKQGTVLTPQDIDKGAIRVVNKYGVPEACWMSYGVKGQLAQLQLQYARDNLNMGARRQVVEQGAAVGKFLASTEDEIRYEPHVVLQPEFGPEELQTLAFGTLAPATPTFSAQPTAGAPGGGETSVFLASDAATYRYKVVAFGPRGRSAPVESNTVAVAAGQKVSMTVNDAGLPLIDRYGVWRTGGPGGTTYKFMGWYAWTGSPTVIADLNAYRPGCSWVFMLSHKPDILQEVRLGPRKLVEFSVPFGTDATNPTSWRYLLLTFIALMLRAPDKIRAWKNCYDPGLVD